MASKPLDPKAMSLDDILSRFHTEIIADFTFTGNPDTDLAETYGEAADNAKQALTHWADEQRVEAWRSGLAQAYKQIELDARNYQLEVKQNAKTLTGGEQNNADQ